MRKRPSSGSSMLVQQCYRQLAQIQSSFRGQKPEPRREASLSAMDKRQSASGSYLNAKKDIQYSRSNFYETQHQPKVAAKSLNVSPFPQSKSVKQKDYSYLSRNTHKNDGLTAEIQNGLSENHRLLSHSSSTSQLVAKLNANLGGIPSHGFVGQGFQINVVNSTPGLVVSSSLLTGKLVRELEHRNQVYEVVRTKLGIDPTAQGVKEVFQTATLLRSIIEEFKKMSGLEINSYHELYHFLRSEEGVGNRNQL